MDITGLKKLDNYVRRQEEQSQWEASANAEDIEFFRCQEQLQEQLLTQYTQVERVIGESVFLMRENLSKYHHERGPGF